LIPYIGDFHDGRIVRYMFNITGSTGASIAPTTLGTVRCYKDNTAGSVNTSGITTAQFNSLTGVYSVSIDTTNVFYVEGADYTVILEGSTIDGQSVTTPLFQFSIANRYDAVSDAVWLAARNQYTSGNTMGHSLEQIRRANYTTDGIVTSTVTPTIYTFSSNLTNESGSIDHQSLLFVTGNHIGTSIPIIDYNQTNGLVTLEEPLHAPPSIGSEFVILPTHVHAVSGIVDAVWDEIASGHLVAGSFGAIMDTLRKGNYVVDGIVTATVSPTPTEFSSNIVALDGTYDHQTVLFLTGDLAGESKPSLTSSQANGLFTMEEAFSGIPQAGDEFVILPTHVHAVSAIADGLLNRLLDSSGNSEDVFNERTVRSALRAMRNKVMVNTGTMAVYKEDDTTAAWEGTISNTADVTVNPDGGSS
jgi:hypothetical protein